MKRTIITTLAAAAILGGTATGANAATTCYSIDVPAVPAVYETVTIPAVTVTEYEFIHRRAADGNGPAVKWQEDPNWNAESNPASFGWEATGNTRVRVITPESTKVTLVTPEVPAYVREECLELPDGVSPVKPGDPSVPLGPQPDPAPAPAPEPAPAVIDSPAPAVAAPAAQPAAVEAPAQPAPLAAVGATQATATAPTELAYTGAADWVLPAGLALVTLGAVSVASRRLFTVK